MLARVGVSVARRVVAVPQAGLALRSVAHVRGYKSRLTQKAFFEGSDLARTAPLKESEGEYVVEDNTPPPFPVPANATVIGFKYPNAKAPFNKTFYAIAPVKPPVVLAGIAGEYAEKLYKAAHHFKSLMATERELRTFVLPLAEDEEVNLKFFNSSTIEEEVKQNAVRELVKQNKVSDIVAGLLLEAVDKGQMEHLGEVVALFTDLMKRVRCEATAHVTFGRIPSRNQLARVKQLLMEMRTPSQLYVNAKYIVDPDIGGGMVLKMGDFELDGSLNTRCDEVQKHLAKTLQV